MENVSEVNTLELEADVSALEEISLQLSWVSHRRLEQELDHFNLTAPQFMALRCIHMNENGCSMSELAESSMQVSATMTGIVDRLVDRGLVTRERLPQDRRSLHVLLTPEGRALLETINASKRAWMRDFLSSLSPQERRQLIAVSRRYLQAMAQVVEPDKTH